MRSLPPGEVTLTHRAGAVALKERWPLVRTDDLKGTIYHPTDGYINPADVTQAMAKGARQHGATIERKWQVDAYTWTGDHWDVLCTKMVEKGGNPDALIRALDHQWGIGEM